MRSASVDFCEVLVDKQYEEFHFLSEYAPAREPKPSFMTLDCDGKKVLTTSIIPSMANKTQTVMVTNQAQCEMTVKNTSVGVSDVLFVNYSIFHGDENSIGSDPIVIIRGDSFVNKISSFNRIKDCFFNKLSGIVDNSTIYTGNDSSHKAIAWLKEDHLSNSICEDGSFIERYALAAIKVALRIVDSQGLWKGSGAYCQWEGVGCIKSSVTSLKFTAGGVFDISGTIPTEIGLLQKLESFEIGKSTMMYQQ